MVAGEIAEDMTIVDAAELLEAVAVVEALVLMEAVIGSIHSAAVEVAIPLFHNSDSCHMPPWCRDIRNGVRGCP